MPDAIIISGTSFVERYGSSHVFNLKAGGEVMTLQNLRRYFKGGRRLTQESAEASALALTYSPYLNGIYLHDFLRQKGIRTEIIGYFDREQDRFRELLAEKPLAVAVSTTFMPDARMLDSVIAGIRQLDSEVPIVVGGPLVFKSYLLYLRRGDPSYDTASPRNDYLFLGGETATGDGKLLFVVEEQGETALFGILRALREGGDPRKLNNLAYYENGELKFSPRCQEDPDPNSFMIAWDKLDRRYVHPIMPVSGGTGCPFKCRFCNFVTYRGFKYKNVDRLRDELRLLDSRGIVKLVRFTDENFFTGPARVQEVCRMMAEENFGFAWASFIRASSITEENVGLLRGSKCAFVQLGLESGDRDMLRNMNKGADPEQYLRVVELLVANGIDVHAYFIAGFPGETDETVGNTIKLINSFPASGEGLVQFMTFPFALLPLAPIYEASERHKHGLEGYMLEWKHRTMTSEEAKRNVLKIFLSARNAFYPYPADNLSALRRSALRDVFRARQAVRQAELAQLPPERTARLWDELEKAARRAEGQQTQAPDAAPSRTGDSNDA